jgi:phospholipid/cholesterol/gamma-HCH transport system substrate-binding protein
MKRRDEVSVGILVTIAVIILVLGTLWLARGGLKSGYPVFTRFVWGQNLKQGQPVLLAGVSVGYVADVNLRRDGYLDVMLRIDDNYTIPKGSTASVKPVGIFGDVAVAITPPRPVPATSYASGDTIPPGAPTPDIAEILGRVDSIGASTQRLAHALEVEVVQAGTLRDFQKTLQAMSSLTAQLQRVAVEQNRNLTATLESFSGAAKRLNSAVDSARIAETAAGLRESSDNLARLIANFDSTNTKIQGMLGRIDRGEGTLGKLMRDSTGFTELRNLMKSADSLLTDFKNNPKKYINVRIFGIG